MRFIPLLWLALSSCTVEKPQQSECDTTLIFKEKTLHAAITSLPNEVIEGLAKEPDAEGALGRNKAGYFHVRFQMDIVNLASYAIYHSDNAALDKFIAAVTYAFRYQLPGGDFKLVIPDKLRHLGQPTEGDLSSGVSFFASSLGASLIELQQSQWFNEKASVESKKKLELLKPGFQSMLRYLKTQKNVLHAYDEFAPNRLLFDAVAFYTLGEYLQDQEAKLIAVGFIEAAVNLQHASGYFIEKKGFDSSYNGVSLKLGTELLGIIPSTEPVYQVLQKSMRCAAGWQVSRVLATGEILTEGNTRVHPDGETFLDQEKSIAWIDTMLAFYFISSLCEEQRYSQLAFRISSYYHP